MPAPVTRKMSDLHERHVAHVLDGTRTRNSGAVWSDQSDGHHLASEEYFKSIIPASLNARIVTPVFMEYKGDKPRVVALMAKRARGMMVRFMAEQAIGDVEDLKTFDYGRYAFSPDLSEGDRWVFVR